MNRKYIYVGVLKGAFSFGAILLNFIIAKYSGGAADVGKISFVLAITLGVSVVGRFGLDNYILRYGSIAITRNDTNLIKYIDLKVQFTIRISLSIVLLLFCFVVINLQKYDIEYAVALVVSTAYMYIYISGAWIKALGRQELSPIFDHNSILFISAIVLGALVYLDGYSFGKVLASLFFVSVFVMLVGVNLVAKDKKKLSNIQRGERQTYVRGDNSELVQMFVFALLGYFSNWGFYLLFGLLLSTYNLGFFGIAYQISLALTLYLVVVNIVNSREYACLHSDNDVEGIEALYKKSTKFSLSLASITAVILIIYGSSILRLFGDDFVSSYNLLVVLVISQLTSIYFGSVLIILIMVGCILKVIQIYILSFIASAFVAVVYIPDYGLSAAGMVVFFNIFLSNAMASYVLYKEKGIRPLFL